ncbi:MAG: hypothetical protein DRI90_16080 [Deltaproteobacteria bacterium]|nr:MAG: hypothetical protein DRI90_16080 [Deltaproteobacteria bacterium]
MKRFGRTGWLVVGMTLALVACDDESTEPGPTGGGHGGLGGVGGTVVGGGGAGTGGAVGGSGGQGGQPIIEGKITISASGLTDADGKRLIATVLVTDTSTQLGAVCATISGNPGSASGVASEPGSTDLCQLGAEVVFDPGTYDVSAGIYAQGEAAPELCAATTVTVAGDVTVVLESFSGCN